MTTDNDKDDEEAARRAARKALEVAIAADPRFRLVSPDGTAVVILGAKPPG
jgi:hypothetical protein